MGKYWYRDGNKWRMRDDEDDGLAIALAVTLICLAWIVWKPISWWLLKREQPKKWQLVLWIVAIVVVLILIFQL